MPVYPALHLRFPQSDPRAGLAIGSAIGKGIKDRRNAAARREAVEQMRGSGQGAGDETYGLGGYEHGVGPGPGAGGGTAADVGGQSPGAYQGEVANVSSPGRANQDAMTDYFVQDPEGAAKLYGFISGMDKAERAETERETETMGRLLNWVQSGGPGVAAPERYRQALEQAEQAGISLKDVPSEYDPNWVASRRALAISVKDQLKRAKASYKERDMPLSGGRIQKQTSADDGQTWKDLGPPTRADKTLTQIFAPDSPSLSKYVPRAEAAGKPAPVKSGITIGTDEHGRPIVKIGGTPGGIQKKTAGDLEKRLVETTENLSRMAEIADTFKPEYQTIATRWGTWLSAIKEKAGLNVSPEDTATLRDFADYKRTAFSAVNSYIKSVTGAQMTEAEASRILKGVPNPGSGILDGDSPTEFASKLRGTVSSARRAAARYTYALRNGLDWKKITLNQIADIMSKRQGEIIKELEAKGLTEEAMTPILEQRLGEEFGLDFGDRS